MKRNSKRKSDRLAAHFKACDPIEPAALGNETIKNTLDEIGAEITDQARRTVRPARRRSIRRWRVALVVAAAAFAITATVAIGGELSARTGHFQPKKYIPMGGPGEDLNPAAPDFRTVALQISSDIPWPEGYESWRDSEISFEIESAHGAEMTTGALHGWFAMSSFCAWVQTWRYADGAGNSGAAAEAAHVISEAPSWKAVTDEDPHPDPTVPGDGGSIQSTVFGWMLPYRDAVLAGDRARVEHLLTTNAYEGHCQFFDPDWRALLTANRAAWGRLSDAQMEQKYEQYLASRQS